VYSEDPTSTDEANAPDSSTLADRTTTRRAVVGASMATAAATLLGTRSGASAQTGSPVASPVAGNAAGKPNIVAIMADDIGYWNISAYNSGMMGYQTPNIDRVGAEGMRFTDAYGEQSCTAGRAAFITGQSPYRTGLIKIGVPGQDQGLSAKDPTIAELLKPLGYATGHYGKNHLGDLNKFLPTVHGFDEFFGNLYHLNAEEEPENPDYPQNPAFAEKYGPRGVIRSFASDVEDPTVDPRFGPVGFQTVEDTGPLDTTRMETIDDEITDGALDYIERQVEADNPFFLWYCPTRMHIFTHLKPESEGVTGLGIEADGMVEHDGHVGQILDKLDELGIADNTIVIYSTDNGAQVFSWPDGSMTPFRSEKNSTWEGGYRIPMMVRWPGQIPAGSLSNGIISLQDWLPTLLSAAGQPDIKEQLLDGYTIGDTTYNVHIDGFDQLPMLTEGVQTLRDEYYYFGDTGQMVGMRQGRWKLIMQEQLSEGFDVWFQPYTELRSPMIVDLLGDPFEKAMQVSGSYEVWMLHHMFLLAPMVQTSQLFLSTFQDYPPRQQNPAE
jgi:arylsulfatase